MTKYALLFALLGLSFSALANETLTCTNNVAALDTQFQAAVAKNDVATMNRLLATDYVLVSSQGAVQTKADLLNEARSGKYVYTRQNDTRQTVRTWGNTAVLTALLTAAGKENGKPFKYHVWFSDTYVCTPHGWLYVFAQVGAHVKGAATLN
ncbi:MAG: nuclear transport factor 2 family protein [Gammaproteobacteria bacterium]